MKRFFFFFVFLVLGTIVSGMGIYFWKYDFDDRMEIEVDEIADVDYPDDPARKSKRYNQYQYRQLNLVKKDKTHFDFIFTSEDPRVATISFKEIDMGLIIPVCPLWVKQDPNMEIVALVEREWNRQQISFSKDSSNISIENGDGFESENLISLELARNCLNAGLFEMMLYTIEDGKKSLFYHGWFDFPLGHYKNLFKKLNRQSYWKHWYRLEHWWDPDGQSMALARLRDVINENEIAFEYDPHELIIANEEQIQKRKTFNHTFVKCWEDFCKEDASFSFATFLSPGIYSNDTPWITKLNKIEFPKKAFLRKVLSPASQTELDEIEIFFEDKEGEITRLIISGILLDQLPSLPASNYSKGFYMPMGIGIPPFNQSYESLKENPPYLNPYFSMLLNFESRWLNHHEIGIDGPVLHRDENNPNLVHLYLLSYERHSLVAHYLLKIPLTESKSISN